VTIICSGEITETADWLLIELVSAGTQLFIPFKNSVAAAGVSKRSDPMVF
jgi:hypothetical protein